ncbi:MAG: four helix bundle protein [bacterium]|jgi:four helix bundle protein
MDKNKRSDNPLVNKSFEFAKQILIFGDKLTEDKRYVIANQIVKSGTSIGANINEAQNAESKSDFLHKLKIATKEAEEVEYWLLLISEVYKQYPIKHLLANVSEILKILNSAISTIKRNNNFK